MGTGGHVGQQRPLSGFAGMGSGQFGLAHNTSAQLKGGMVSISHLTVKIMHAAVSTKNVESIFTWLDFSCRELIRENGLYTEASQ